MLPLSIRHCARKEAHASSTPRHTPMGARRAECTSAANVALACPYARRRPHPPAPRFAAFRCRSAVLSYVTLCIGLALVVLLLKAPARLRCPPDDAGAQPGKCSLRRQGRASHPSLKQPDRRLEGLAPMLLARCETVGAPEEQSTESRLRVHADQAT